MCSASALSLPAHPCILEGGSDFTKGFESKGNLFPNMPVGDYIANVPDFWKKDQTSFGADLLHFGSDVYWFGNYTRNGSGFGESYFVPLTPQQTMAHGAVCGHGFFDDVTGDFVW